MSNPARRDSLHAGARAGIPFAVAAFAVAASFGVLARPVMGTVAPIVMSTVVFAGSSQFAATAVLAAGGGAVAAVVAGILLNVSYAPMGIALAPSLEGKPLSRALHGQAMIDASWAMASRGEGPSTPRSWSGRRCPRIPPGCSARSSESSPAI